MLPERRDGPLQYAIFVVCGLLVHFSKTPKKNNNSMA
ncbi:MAG: hypothetical protein ACI9BW_002346, partial [Gammaproteobacteria bacterium]